jgi:hypothetical protein
MPAALEVKERKELWEVLEEGNKYLLSIAASCSNHACKFKSCIIVFIPAEWRSG